MRRLSPLLVLILAVTGLRAADAPPASAADLHCASHARALAITRLSSAMGKELQTNILSYWLDHARNPANKGFYGWVDAANTPNPTADRGALLTARILWTFSAAYRHDPRPEYLEMARYAFADFQAFLDPEQGGLIWSLAYDGKPVVTNKEIYVQTFGIYGLAEYYRATGDVKALEQAKALYRLIDAHAYDPKHGGYFESFSRDWNAPTTAGRRSLVGMGHEKSQNTNLHVLECLTQLVRVWPDDSVRARLKELIFVMRDKVRDPATNHLILFADAAWKPANDECSYGHDIEFSWLLTEAAEVAGGEELVAQVKPVVLAMVDTVLREGTDKDGGIFDSGTAKQGVIKTHKEWWPQAEAVVGFINAYQLSGDARYLTAAQKTWSFIESTVADPKGGGEWLQYATNDAGQKARMPKISLWKCPYHNSRACLEIQERAAGLTSIAETN